MIFIKLTIVLITFIHEDLQVGAHYIT